ncbi:hemin-degrading factor [Microvirga tunisiensis]|uniref:Hemin-degrading factor n=2 Tax=Pannonibacter tanglangensis TaxID=2750084 RepID=A0A7X5F136_9HYPH|nr:MULTISPECIES: ChuX/HutX family heme-like substrate-binding protein [unclassified Pannonibacter]NBN62159.1 hemin-degrading factor [Pannonibacter sp. XCT-34]NBN77827.1 hemin-degrading factor [Pannonibacter sp. XCT-53]
MTTTTSPRPGAEAIRAAVAAHPERRERDLARDLGVTEAELVAAFCGAGVTRLTPSLSTICNGMKTVGEVMALTRNESAVHEKIGPFEKFVDGSRAAMMLGSAIDTRMFPSHWVHAFAVEKPGDSGPRRSIQVFDAHGDAVHKIHLRPASDVAAYEAVVASLRHPDQSAGLGVEPVAALRPERPALETAKETELRRRWSAMTDPHQFFGLLRDLELHRLNALELAGDDWAWKVDGDAVRAMMRLAADNDIPIMCFVGNRGCIQIHSGPVSQIKEMGPWINVLDPTFHLHLRLDHIAEVWAVRKNADQGHVTSLEAYDADGQQIIQFFGLRKEGRGERADWRELVEHLPRVAQRAVA